ncbi:MAG: hypothetical protein JWM40_3068, partial [Frankiales bacterium]|nr:hypothetical protein [Frankiales bacterium]
VAPAERRLEIRTAPTSRIDDATAQAALDQLAPYLRAGDLIGGVKAALRLLAEAAGPVPPGSVPLPELPDVLTG